jgi:hypothetical protein
MKTVVELKRQSNEVGFCFVMSDLELGETLLDIASISANSERQERLSRQTQAVLNRVTRLLPCLTLTAEQRSDVDFKFRHLELRLGRFHPIPLANTAGKPLRTTA